MFARPSALTFFLFFLLPFFGLARCFSGSLGRSRDFTAQELIQLILQRVNLLLEVGCIPGVVVVSRLLMFIRELRSYLVPRIASLAALAMRNFTTRLAGILMVSPVAGFRPIRALRFTSTSLPKPGMVNLFLAFLYARATRASSASSGLFLGEADCFSQRSCNLRLC